MSADCNPLSASSSLAPHHHLNANWSIMHNRMKRHRVIHSGGISFCVLLWSLTYQCKQCLWKAAEFNVTYVNIWLSLDVDPYQAGVAGRIQSYIVAIHSDKHAAAARRDPGVATPLLQSQQILLQLLHKSQARVLVHISTIGEDVEPHLLATMVGGRLHDVL